MKRGLIISLVIIAIIVVGVVIYFINTNKSGIDYGNNAIQQEDSGSVNSNGGSNGEVHEINIADFAFSPPTINIKKGDTVKWTNKDSATHTVTSSNSNELNSATLSRDGSYSYTFKNSGTFDYYCKIHPSMKAKVIVE